MLVGLFADTTHYITAFVILAVRCFGRAIAAQGWRNIGSLRRRSLTGGTGTLQFHNPVGHVETYVAGVLR